MNYEVLGSNRQDEVTGLFRSVFTLSEGEQEGALIGNLVAELSSRIDNRDIICLGAHENKPVIGAIFFTRLHFSQDIQIYMLAPVAVSPEHQGKGIGQALINYGLDELRNRGVKVAITYGDPSFYSRVGFKPLSEDVIQAPLELSMPIGWLGQSLTDDPVPTISERPRCVKAFDNPAYW